MKRKKMQSKIHVFRNRNIYEVYDRRRTHTISVSYRVICTYTATKRTHTHKQKRRQQSRTHISLQTYYFFFVFFLLSLPLYSINQRYQICTVVEINNNKKGTYIYALNLLSVYLYVCNKINKLNNKNKKESGMRLQWRQNQKTKITTTKTTQKHLRFGQPHCCANSFFPAGFDPVRPCQQTLVRI